VNTEYSIELLNRLCKNDYSIKGLYLCDVLFTLLDERYEMRSVLITSNLVFAKWNTIFKDDMTTSAAIDRLVHHSTILELNTESYRIATAKEKKLTVKSEDIM